MIQVIDLFFAFLPALGAAAVIFLAQTQVRERSEQAALALTIGGGVEVAYLLARHFFLHNNLLWAAAPLVQVTAVSGVAFGLIILMNELNPKVAGTLPQALAAFGSSTPNIFLRVFWGGFALLAMFAMGMQLGPIATAAGALGVVATLAGSVWVERQGPLGRWVLERRPELVVWSYVHQLRVTNRKTGSTSVHWSAQIGLASGAMVPLAAIGEQHAQTLVAAVHERCPGIALGYSEENFARFKSSPETMRGGVPAPFRGVG